jgi:hypothetical protein
MWALCVLLAAALRLAPCGGPGSFTIEIGCEPTWIFQARNLIKTRAPTHEADPTPSPSHRCLSHTRLMMKLTHTRSSTTSATTTATSCSKQAAA